ncbi:MAG: radical SAM family heme chaperone HemW [Clostridia bacterium]|nr:radical SAM family heme chaperone HemW [Clostridia bacterium]MDR3645463.1 radical SAM family heme chaperone HemW [Clostridia bacterium]
MSEPRGLYIHIPFCAGGKCPYCDFYSVAYSAQAGRRYVGAVKEALAFWGRRAAGLPFDTVYFGGGTPPLLGEGLAELLEAVRGAFRLSEGAEVTLEANPASALAPLLPLLRGAGFNRISMGLQSAQEGELALLGRKHTTQDAAQAVEAARAAGFENISLDLMLATPGQIPSSLRHSVEFAAMPGVKHISAYMLKIEPGTPFGKAKELPGLPGEEAQRALYLLACEELARRGFIQYEISNFAFPGYESRHNLIYWHDGEYLGIGPAAHSFFGGRRFHYPRSLEAFLSGAGPEQDGEGGDFEEYCMLRLRLCEGLEQAQMKQRFGRGFEALDGALIERCAAAGLLVCSDGRLCLTREGFLVSNAVIGGLLYGGGHG